MINVSSGAGEISVTPSNNGGFIISVHLTPGWPASSAVTPSSVVAKAYAALNLDDAMLIIREQLALLQP